MVLLLSLAACAIPTGPVEVTRFNRSADGIVYGSGTYNVTPAGERRRMQVYRSPLISPLSRAKCNGLAIKKKSMAAM
jgi:hypothetical protein